MAAEPDYRHVLAVRHPFWEQLSPTTVQQRIDQLLAAPDSPALIQALSPVEYAVLLKEAPEMRPTLLALAQPEQIRIVLDLDCWDKEALQSARVLEWVEDLQRSGEDVYAEVLATLDEEVLILALRHYIRVYATPPPEEDDEARPYDEVLANELYRLDFLDLDSTWNERIVDMLRFLRMADFDLYHNLMQGVMWGQDSELAEWAYRWKSGRLQDEGFPDYYEALEEAYRVVAVTPSSLTGSPPPLPPGRPVSAEETGVIPSYAWGLTPSGSGFAQALAENVPDTTLERLCWEMVALCNRELVLDQIDFADANAVRASLQRVHAYLNVGIEYLNHHESQSLTALLTTHALRAVYQIGWSLSINLHRRAVRLQTYLNTAMNVRRAVLGLERYVLDGLLRVPPQFFVGLVSPGTMEYREFLHLQEITQVDGLIQQLEHELIA